MGSSSSKSSKKHKEPKSNKRTTSYVDKHLLQGGGSYPLVSSNASFEKNGSYPSVRAGDSFQSNYYNNSYKRLLQKRKARRKNTEAFTNEEVPPSTRNTVTPTTTTTTTTVSSTSAVPPSEAPLPPPPPLPVEIDFCIRRSRKCESVSSYGSSKNSIRTVPSREAVKFIISKNLSSDRFHTDLKRPVSAASYTRCTGKPNYSTRSSTTHVRERDELVLNPRGPLPMVYVPYFPTSHDTSSNQCGDFGGDCF